MGERLSPWAAPLIMLCVLERHSPTATLNVLWL